MNLLKSSLDVVLSFMALLVFFPLFIVIAIAIKIDSHGPVFFKQGRLTIEGREFEMYKFRSMIVNAESSGTGLFNYENDSRVTKIGRSLRKLSLDELPQLINVLLGDMSIVGPRPPVTYELGDFETLNSRYKKRFRMKAGITGLAQVNGRNGILWDEKVRWDNEYIDLFQKQGIWIDIKIIFLTIAKVFKHIDIYEQKTDEYLDDAESARIAEEEIIRRAHLSEEYEVAGTREEV